MMTPNRNAFCAIDQPSEPSSTWAKGFLLSSCACACASASLLPSDVEDDESWAGVVFSSSTSSLEPDAHCAVPYSASAARRGKKKERVSEVHGGSKTEKTREKTRGEKEALVFDPFFFFFFLC